MPAIIPFIPAIIGAGGSIASSLINKSAAGKATGGGSGSLLPPGLDQNALLGLVNKQTGVGDFLGAQGKSNLEQGGNTLAGPLSYYHAIANGDRTAMSEAMAPELGAINAQFQAPLKEAAFTGRNGGLQGDLEAQKQSAITNAFLQQRPAANDKLTGIAQTLMNLGTQQTGMGSTAIGSASNQLLDYNSIIRGLQAQGARDSSQMWGGLGAQLGPLLGQVLGGVFSKGGAGGGVQLPTANPGSILGIAGPPNPFGG